MAYKSKIGKNIGVGGNLETINAKENKTAKVMQRSKSPKSEKSKSHNAVSFFVNFIILLSIQFVIAFFPKS